MRGNVDVVMLSAGKTPELREMTHNAITSLQKSEDEWCFRIGLIDRYASYRDVINIDTPASEFNYNAYMQYGKDLLEQEFRNTPSNWLVMANNDVIFHKNWFSEIADIAPIIGCDSFSPWNPTDKWPYDGRALIGYRVGDCVCGWCIVVYKPAVFPEIGRLDERCKFWCADNLYAKQIQKAGIRHCLVRDSHVTHLGGKTLFTESPDEINMLTAKQAEIFAGLQ